MKLRSISLAFVFLLCAYLAVAQTMESGYAVYYADYLEGRQTASGELFSNSKLTCAHRTLPFGTLLKVTRSDNQRSVLVRVNDRGPHKEGLLIDLSKAAAFELDFLSAGKAFVQIEVMGEASVNPLPQNARRSNSDLTAKGIEPAVLTPQLQKGNSGFFIQFASYTDLHNAERQLQALQQKGLLELSLHQETNTQGAPLYKILTGPFKLRSEAQTFLQGVKAQYYLDGYVFHKP